MQAEAIKTKNYVETLNEQQTELKPFTMNPIESERQSSAGWSIEINGETQESVAMAKITQPKMGVEINYGMRPEGYDGISIHENGGGGSVTIPYMIHPETGHVYVGLVKEYRPMLGGEVWNVPRGFIDFGETHQQAAEREVVEEMGYENKQDAGRIIKLAEGLNPNSTYFDTSNTNEDGTPEGVSIFGMPLHQDNLEKTTDETGKEVYVFPSTVRDTVEGDATAERIFGSMFVPIQEAMMSRDMFTSAAAGQLLVRLMR